MTTSEKLQLAAVLIAALAALASAASAIANFVTVRRATRAPKLRIEFIEGRALMPTDLQASALGLDGASHVINHEFRLLRARVHNDGPGAAKNPEAWVKVGPEEVPIPVGRGVIHPNGGRTEFFEVLRLAGTERGLYALVAGQTVEARAGEDLDVELHVTSEDGSAQTTYELTTLATHKPDDTPLDDFKMLTLLSAPPPNKPGNLWNGKRPDRRWRSRPARVIVWWPRGVGVGWRAKRYERFVVPALVLAFVVGPAHLDYLSRDMAARLDRGEPSLFLEGLDALDRALFSRCYALDDEHATTGRSEARFLRPPQELNFPARNEPSKDAASEANHPTKYAFCGGNPVSRFDALGLDDDPLGEVEFAAKVIWATIVNAFSGGNGDGGNNSGSTNKTSGNGGNSAPQRPSSSGGDSNAAPSAPNDDSATHPADLLVPGGSEIRQMDRSMDSALEHLKVSTDLSNQPTPRDPKAQNAWIVNSTNALTQFLRDLGDAAEHGQRASVEADMAFNMAGGKIAPRGVVSPCPSKIAEKEIEQAADQIGAKVWGLDRLKRGAVVEQILAATEYKDFYYVGKDLGGKSAIVDFVDASTAVSLKTVDPNSATAVNDMLTAIRQLARVDVKQYPTRILDIRVPAGTQGSMSPVQAYGQTLGIKVVVKSFP